MIDTVLFDLDGTLLPMDQEKFIHAYMRLLSAKMMPYGYEPEPFVKAVWTGTGAMVRNDGTRTNETVFWDTFRSILGPGVAEHKPLFDEFYASEFAGARTACGFSAGAAEVIDLLHRKGAMCVLATNPLFPDVATSQRIRWAGLAPEDFELYTVYENSSFCKPNPEYYRDILRRIDKQPEQCIMVGNDVDEDMIAETLGMKVFLLTDCLINKHNADITGFPRGGFAELKQFLEETVK